MEKSPSCKYENYRVQLISPTQEIFKEKIGDDDESHETNRKKINFTDNCTTESANSSNNFEIRCHEAINLCHSLIHRRIFIEDF